MKNTAYEISEAELFILKALWKAREPITAQQVCDFVGNKNWKYTTVSTLLSRLAKKKAIAHNKLGKSYYYYPLITEEDFKQKQTSRFISKIYGGSVKKLAVSLFQSGDLSEDDIKEIKDMFNL